MIDINHPTVQEKAERREAEEHLDLWAGREAAGNGCENVALISCWEPSKGRQRAAKGPPRGHQSEKPQKERNFHVECKQNNYISAGCCCCCLRASLYVSIWTARACIWLLILLFLSGCYSTGETCLQADGSLTNENTTTNKAQMLFQTPAKSRGIRNIWH